MNAFPVAGKVKGKPKTKKNIAVGIGDPSDVMGEDLGGISDEEECAAWSSFFIEPFVETFLHSNKTINS